MFKNKNDSYWDNILYGLKFLTILSYYLKNEKSVSLSVCRVKHTFDPKIRGQPGFFFTQPEQILF